MEQKIEKENMKGFLPKGDKNVGKCFNAGKNCKDNPVHRGVFFQFPFRWIYYYGSNESTRKETGKTHLCAVHHPFDLK